MLRRGAFAEVQVGEDADSTRVALKRVVNASRAANGATAAAREADLLRRVQHVNVVELLDVRHEALGDVLVLEWCCCDLEQATRPRLEPLPEAAIRVLFADLLHALAACHEAGVVHLDVKPANLLFGRDRRLKLADFGNAACVDDAVTGPRPGSRWYRAPELLYGSSSADVAADLWSAGCVLGELLGNSPLFPGVSDVDQLAQIHAGLGAPTDREGQWLAALPGAGGITFNTPPDACLDDALPDAPAGAMRLLGCLLRYMPPTRTPADEALRHEWLAEKGNSMSRDELERLLLHPDE